MTKYFSDSLQELQDSAAQSKWSFRRNALQLFRDYGLPHRKQDPWKYVDNSALLNLAASSDSAASDINTTGSTNQKKFKKKVIYDDIIFCDDQLCTKAEQKSIQKKQQTQSWNIRNLSFENDLERDAVRWGLDAESLAAERNSYSLINAFSFEQAYLLEVSPKVEAASTRPAENICLRFCSAAESAESPDNLANPKIYLCPRIYVEIPEQVKINILLDTRDLNSGVYWNPYFHFALGKGANVQVLQRGPALSGTNSAAGAAQNIYSVTLRGDVATGAQLHNVLFYWGMDLAIHDARFALRGEESQTSMRGLCFAEGKAAYHLRSEQQHLCENSRSQSLYKNVLFDQAKTEFYGIIHAERYALGTDAAQKNQNLLLSEQARAISRPQLEIRNDDLQCSHSSATGSIDAEELFYMRSRGLAQGLAMRMAVVGFVEEISTYFDAELLDILGIEECLQILLGKRSNF